MKAVIFNFGNPGKLTATSGHIVNYIPEASAELNERGITQHYDPDLVHWLFGDYPAKPAKTKLQHIGLGDVIFFTNTLRGRQIPTAQYFIAAMVLATVKTLAELEADQGEACLRSTPL